MRLCAQLVNTAGLRQARCGVGQGVVTARRQSASGRGVAKSGDDASRPGRGAVVLRVFIIFV